MISMLLSFFLLFAFSAHAESEWTTLNFNCNSKKNASTYYVLEGEVTFMDSRPVSTRSVSLGSSSKPTFSEDDVDAILWATSKHETHCDEEDIPTKNCFYLGRYHHPDFMSGERLSTIFMLPKGLTAKPNGEFKVYIRLYDYSDKWKHILEFNCQAQ